MSAALACPDGLAWCTRHLSLVDPGASENVHEAPIGDYDVAVCLDGDGVRIMPPDVRDLVPVDVARQLVSDLAAAVTLANRIEGASVTPSPIARALVEGNRDAARQLVAELVEMLAATE